MNSSYTNDATNKEIRLDRRKFLALGLLTAASGIIPFRSFAAESEYVQGERALHIYNPYSDEELHTVYWKDNNYIPEALSDINYILRDIHTGKVKAISTNLLDLLFNIKRDLKTGEPFRMISGYRTPRSNALLSQRKKGVAKNSLHMYGKAIDISLPGCSLRALRHAAMNQKCGGVGYYPRSNFIHVDVGNIRYWRG